VKDYYKILELSPDASRDEIQKQWRFLVQAWHPDRFAHLDHKRRAEEKFKDINEAYEVLSHPQYRQAYNARRAKEELQRKAQAERAEKERQREELRQQEEAARRRAREEQKQREQVNAARHRAEAERQHTAQAKAELHSVPAWVIFCILMLLWLWLLVSIYDSE